MTEKVFVLHPVLPARAQDAGVAGFAVRDPDAALAEAVGLAGAIALDVAHEEVVRLSKIHPATLLGGGVIDRIRQQMQEAEAGLLYLDSDLTPGQQRNLERALDCKVIDRTGLILEIFGARARTREGQLQVQLAALEFQRSRLVKLWTHLERQRGGLGKVGGPGETQKEMDRRILDEKIRKLKADLEVVRKNRALQRESRRKEPYPIVALVGYTNAGKSTLFNRLTGAGVFAKDLLFATLDTTMRALPLPSGQNVILSDTVGFISALPTGLIAAFRATLEEVQEAAVILHVRDISCPQTEAERADVHTVLRDLGIDPETDPRMMEILNKTDLLPAPERAVLEARCQGRDDVVAVSALDGTGVAEMLARIDALVTRERETVMVDVDIADGEALSWLYRRGHILARRDDDDCVHVKVSMDPVDCDRFKSRFPYKVLILGAAGA